MKKQQQDLGIKEEKKVTTVEGYEFEPIRGQPMLRWAGKRPFTSTQYFPAQEKERYGDETDGWMNELYWGDNLQVMSHLLKKYRGRVNLIYIDPPFDSKADYKKRITLRGKAVIGDRMGFEEKQYTDIWTNDEYLQFMYERLILCRELLADTGALFLECDPTRGHYLKVMLDEIFGADNFVNQIIWKRTFSHGDSGQGAKHLGRLHDIIFFCRKTSSVLLNTVYTPYSEQYIKDFYKYEKDGRRYRLVSLLGPGGAAKGNPFYEFMGVKRYWVHSKEKMDELLKEGRIVQTKPGAVPQKIRYLDESPGVPLQDIWVDIAAVQGGAIENCDYPTQKPEKLLERIILSCSNPGDIVFDCFMGSGTTQAVAMKLGRRFIGADINLGAIQTTTKRLLGVAAEIGEQLPNQDEPKYTGFTVYNVNNYDVFRNPVEAKDLLVQALELDPLPDSSLYDGEKDEWFYKIMPVNRLATKADLNEIVTGFDWKAAEKKSLESPGKPVLKLRLVCMGHEPDLAASLEKQFGEFKVEVEVIDILRDKSQLVFKRDSEAKIVKAGGKLKIKAFYPMNLLKKLSIQKSKVGDWKELVDSVMIDFNYDGAVFTPTVVDVPKDGEFVKGEYAITADAGTIRVKITDLLAESLEMEVE